MKAITLSGIGHIVLWEGPGIYVGKRNKGTVTLRKATRPVSFSEDVVIKEYTEEPKGEQLGLPE